jgi:fatty-acyl-CoA synthase
VFSTNRIECVDLYLATGKVGAILVPFNVRFSLQELEYLIRKTSPSILFYDPKLESQAVDIKSKNLIGKNIVLGRKSIQNDPTSHYLMNKALKSEIEKPSINFEDPHLILFTGGTTGLPKGAILSHRLIFWNSVNTILSWGLNSEDVQPLFFPLFHTGGWNGLLVPFYHLGAKTILMGDFNPEESLRIIDDQNLKMEKLKMEILLLLCLQV